MTAPVVCLITDRLRLATVVQPHDESAAAQDEQHIQQTLQDALLQQVRVAARAGVHLVQIRERDLEGRALYDLVVRCVAAVTGTSTRILVNDRVDVAMAAGAHGVHLRGTSFPAARVRAIAPRGFVVGRSVHEVDEVRRVTAEGGLDYVVFGPVYATASKPGRSEAGIDALRDVAAATTLPVLALGGITPDRIGTVMRAGAVGMAAIGVFIRDPNQLPAIVGELRQGVGYADLQASRQP